MGFPEVLLQQQGHVGLLADTPPSEGAFLDEACQPFWEAAILSHRWLIVSSQPHPLRL